MSKANGSKSFLKTYGFLIFMISGIVAGCLVGAFAPTFGGKIKFLGTLFINMMFCVVVPMVFCSIASAIANMKSVKRAGKIMGVTIATFLVTAAIAGVLMYIVCRIFPLVDGHYTITEGEIGDTLGFGDMIVNFFTKPDFMELLSRKAILPLIVAAVLFGFGVQMNGGPETKTAQLLEDITGCIMKTVKLITYYAPIGFFGFFADLVATYGPELVADYSRTLIIYYVMSFVYMFVFFPIYAQFGGGKGGAKIMFSKLFRPAAMSFGTCSSVATIPTNMEVAEETGISKDVTDIVLPMGATMHMDGSAMSAIIKVAFLFGVFGLDFTTEKAILAIIVQCSPPLPCPVSPAAAAPASWWSAPSSSPTSWLLPTRSRWRSATSSILRRPWSTPPATMSCPSSSPAMWTARIGCRRSLQRRKRTRQSSSNLPMYQIPSTRKHYGVPDGRNFLCLEKSRSAVSTQPS